MHLFEVIIWLEVKRAFPTIDHAKFGFAMTLG